MDKPFCKICGQKHSGITHVWRTVKGTTPEYVKKVKKFDRVKYQREYMRKRRSK